MKPGRFSTQFSAVAALALAAAVACDAPTAPAGSPALRASRLLLLTGDEAAILGEAGITPVEPGEGEQAATGGVWYAPTDKDAAPEMLAFSAVLHRDGTVSGEYEYRSADGLIRMHGPVTCLSVDDDGTSARFSGPVTQPVPDVEQFFYVEDNGEGSDSPPDRVVGPLSGASCAKGTKVPVGFPVVRGNLQVHP